MKRPTRTPEGAIELLERLRPEIPWRQWKKNCSARLITETAIAARDKALTGRHSVCAICGRSGGDDGGYHFDHIVPLCAGGQHHIDNIQFTCSGCNQSKGGRYDGS